MDQVDKSRWVAARWKVWQLSCRRLLMDFESALSDPEKAQQRVLSNILRLVHGTQFARDFGINASSSISQFRERVPVQDADAMEQQIQRIRQGHQNVLCNRKVERLVPTSGSTGPHKLIPMTRKGRRDYARAVDLWIGKTMELYPEVCEGSCYVATSPMIAFADPDSRIPVGFADDSAYLSLPARMALSGLLAVPPSVSTMEYNEWRQHTRDMLWNACDLTFLSIWHPSYLLNLFSEDEMAELTHRWPNLKVISCWADGMVHASASRLLEMFPGAALQPKGLWLTEGVVSVPWDGGTASAILNTFLEFETASGEVLLVHELNSNAVYRPVISNRFGLYRYRTGDLVRVTGLNQQTPMLEWIGRADRVSDLCGEKLSEGQVNCALNSIGYQGFVVVLPVIGKSVSHYRLVTCEECPINKTELETQLRKNPHYDWARKLGQLDTMEIITIPGRLANVLENYLIQKQGTHKKFKCLILDKAIVDEILEKISQYQVKK